MTRSNSQKNDISQNNDDFCLTNKEKLLRLLQQLELSHAQFSGRVEIHFNRGSIRSVLKVETVELAD